MTLRFTLSTPFLFFVSLLAFDPSAQAETAAATENRGTAAATERALTFDDAMTLSLKNNRDIQAARERLRGTHSDVEKALAALMPTLTASGKLTINEPEVSLGFPDSSGQVISGALQSAQIADLQLSTGNTAMQAGAATQAVLDLYCKNPATDGVRNTCEIYTDPQKRAQALKDLGKQLVPPQVATIVPRAQVDGILALNMPLIAPPAYPALKSARLAFDAQKKTLETTIIQILTTVATAFYTAAGNDEVVGARRHAIEVAQKTLDNAKVRLAAGVVNKVEVTRAQLAIIQAEQRLLEAIDAREAAYRTLATLIRIEAGSFKVQPPPEPNIELSSEGQLVNQALQNRPELQGNELQARALGQQVFSSWLRWSPTLSLFGNIRLTNATSFAGRIDSYAVGLQLDWLLFDGFGRDAQRHSFEAQQRDALLRLDQLRSTISDEVINGRRAVITKKQGLFTASRSVQMAQEALELVRTQYQAGTATQLDLLNAQDALIQAEVGVVQARFDLSLAVINVRRLTGESLVPSGAQLR